MLRRTAVVLALAAPLAACSTESPEASEVGSDPAESGDGKADTATGLADVRCDHAPILAPHLFRHASNTLQFLKGGNHRGYDLVAESTEATQHLRGMIAYGLTDKPLVDELVDVLACKAGSWQAVGTALTNSYGEFDLALTGDNRMPRGMRDLYLSVRGDRTGTRFLALVAPAGTRAAVSDVDGTLTSSENAYPLSLVTGDLVDIQPGAPDAFGRLRASGHVPVYVTARGSRFTDDTRDWLDDHDMPRGPMRLAPSLITFPGSDTVDFKTGAFDDLTSHGLDIALGIGNRASDVEAYTNAGVDRESIYIKLPEYISEVAGQLDDRRAVGFDSYATLAR
jgi:hypothetical protein